MEKILNQFCAEQVDFCYGWIFGENEEFPLFAIQEPKILEKKSQKIVKKWPIFAIFALFLVQSISANIPIYRALVAKIG